jgi:hypothetical protein
MVNSAPILVITCAAIAREVNEIKKLGQWSQMDLQAITADLHARPEKIAPAVASKIDAARDQYQHIFVAYGDCGTSGELDRVLEERGVKRLPGAHCYDFLAGRDSQHFQRLVIEILGIDRHPELLEMYFGNYTRLVYLAQTDSPELTALAQDAADQLGVRFERVFTGMGEMVPELDAAMQEAMWRS